MPQLRRKTEIMYNFWFAVENPASLSSLKKGIARPEVNATWYPATPRQSRPFNNLTTALSQAARNGRVDALFYESNRQPMPPAALIRRRPTLLSLEAISSFPENLPKELAKITPAGLVVGSEWAKTQLVNHLKIAPSRILVTHTGLDLANWDEALQAFERARANKTGLPERVRLLFVGDDFVGLGGTLLLDLLKNKPRLAESCELHLVVNRRTAATYLASALLPNYVHVHSYIYPQNEPTELYLKADICVLPSYKPVSPALVAKAMAACLPIIATNIGGLPEMVRDGQSGLLIEPGDQSGLVLALQTLVEDPARRYALGEGARRIAEAEFDAATNAHKILTFMKQITAEARSNHTFAASSNFSQLAVANIPPDTYPNVEE